MADLYSETKNRFLQKFPQYQNSLPKNFGFGIGYEFREKINLISPKNTVNKVNDNSCFTLITSLSNLSEGDKKYCLHLADTVIFSEGKVTNITKKVNFNFVDIGYDMEQQKKQYDQK